MIIINKLWFIKFKIYYFDRTLSISEQQNTGVEEIIFMPLFALSLEDAKKRTNIAVSQINQAAKDSNYKFFFQYCKGGIWENHKITVSDFQTYLG